MRDNANLMRLVKYDHFVCPETKLKTYNLSSLLRDHRDQKYYGQRKTHVSVTRVYLSSWRNGDTECGGGQIAVLSPTLGMMTTDVVSRRSRVVIYVLDEC